MKSVGTIGFSDAVTFEQKKCGKPLYGDLGEEFSRWGNSTGGLNSHKRPADQVLGAQRSRGDGRGWGQEAHGRWTEQNLYMVIKTQVLTLGAVGATRQRVGKGPWGGEAAWANSYFQRGPSAFSEQNRGQRRKQREQGSRENNHRRRRAGWLGLRWTLGCWEEVWTPRIHSERTWRICWGWVRSSRSRGMCQRLNVN